MFLRINVMNRYKIKKVDFEKAKQYLAGKLFKKNSPSWAVKFKERLTVKKGKVLFDGLEIIAQEDADAYLRKMLYEGDKVAFSRDTAFHHIKKQAVGLSRRYVMDFIRGQRVNEMGQAAPSGYQKGKGGKPISNYVFEFDLIFVRRNDLEKNNKRFKKYDQEDLPFESYIISVVEKSTGLTSLSYTKTKKAKIVTPRVIKQIQDMCKILKVDPKKVTSATHSGGEFHIPSILKIVKSHKTEKLAPSIEQKNRSIQKQMFNVVRARKTFDLQDAIKKAQVLVNNSYNANNKMTLESAELAESTTTSNYNKARKKGLPGRKLKTGDWVRLLVKDLKAGIDFKSYKGETFSKQVFQITAETKKVPKKFRVKGRWRVSQHLLKSKPVDQVSEKLVRDREEKQDEIDNAAQKKLLSANRARLAADVAKAKKKDELEKAKPPPKRKKPLSKRFTKLAAEAAAFIGKDSVPSMRKGRRRAREKMVTTQEREAQRDKEIGL